MARLQPGLRFLLLKRKPLRRADKLTPMCAAEQPARAEEQRQKRQNAPERLGSSRSLAQPVHQHLYGAEMVPTIQSKAPGDDQAKNHGPVPELPVAGSHAESNPIAACRSL